MMSTPGVHPPRAAQEAGRQVDQPRAGYFTIRLVRRGVRIPARIIHTFGAFQAIVDGKAAGPPHTDPHEAKGVFNLWHYGHEIDRDTYDRMLRERTGRPDPTKPVDLNALPPLF